MATLYFGNTGSSDWNIAANWGTITGGGGAHSVPLLTDDAVIDNLSGTCVASGASVCHNLTITSVLTPALTIGELRVYGTANLPGGNIVVTNISGILYVEVGSSVSTPNSVPYNNTGIDRLDVVIAAGCTNEAQNLCVKNGTVNSILSIVATAYIRYFEASSGAYKCYGNCDYASLFYDGPGMSFYVYGGQYILGTKANDYSMTIGAGGGSGTINLGIGEVSLGNYGASSLTISDFAVGSSLLYYAYGAASINYLTITTCSNNSTFDFNGMKITNQININGNNKLTVTGDVTYSGIKTGCNITNTTVHESDASSGNPIWAQDPSNVDG